MDHEQGSKWEPNDRLIEELAEAARIKELELRGEITNPKKDPAFPKPKTPAIENAGKDPFQK